MQKLLGSDGSRYKVKRPVLHVPDVYEVHVIDIPKKVCTCCVWQEHELPCVPALAFFKDWEGRSFPDILEYLPSIFKYSNQQMLTEKNIEPVIIDRMERQNYEATSECAPS